MKEILLSSVLAEMGIHEYKMHNETTFCNMSMLLPRRDEKKRCVFILSEDYFRKVDDSVNMIITTYDLFENAKSTGKGVCAVENPRLVFYKLHNYLSTKEDYLNPTYATTIGDNCKISKLADISPNNVKIGNNVVIDSFVKIEDGVEIGDNTIIRSGVVIGTPGYDYKVDDGEVIPTAQTGTIVIGKNVELNANAVIEKPAFPYEKTIVGDDCKIGSLCYIAHGVQLGKRVMMPNSVSVSGYTFIGDDVLISPNATISNIIKIGDRTHVTLGSVVASNVRKDSHVTGYFAIDHDKYLRKMLQDNG